VTNAGSFWGGGQVSFDSSESDFWNMAGSAGLNSRGYSAVTICRTALALSANWCLAGGLPKSFPAEFYTAMLPFPSRVGNLEVMRWSGVALPTSKGEQWFSATTVNETLADLRQR
jgi:hypothetical protein